MPISLRKLPLPATAFPAEPCPAVPPAEYAARLDILYDRSKVDWVVVYADREHYANLTYLLNFDPRFEEVLLVLGPNRRRVLVLGNEDMGYTSVLPFPVETALCQSFSLGGQKRDSAPRLLDVLRKIGIRPGQTAGAVGWKYLEPTETDDPTAPAFFPAFFADVLRKLAGPDGVVGDATALMMHPQNGLRSINTAAQIAVFEWAARAASAAVHNVVNRARPGMTELQAAALLGYSGLPMSMHPILASGKGAVNGLRSPGTRLLEYGDAVAATIGYWGSLCCRAGLLQGEPDPAFFDAYVSPYFGAIAAWYKAMRLGTTGGEVFTAVQSAFAGSPVESMLNPGHLASYDEWSHTPIRPGSLDCIRSGMAFQVDIIPTPLPEGKLLNCEDTIAIADETLRAEIEQSYPEMWARIQSRREYMRVHLGLTLALELLPLSDACAYLAPFWLAPDLACAME